VISRDELLRIVSYDPETGAFTWLTNGRRAGGVSDRKGKTAYERVRILGRLYYAHRLAWFYMTGEWPLEIDHIDRDGTNNRWSNIRSADRSINNRNKGVRSDCLSGRRGIYWWPSRGKYQARTFTDAGRRTIGYFDNIEDAAKAIALVEQPSRQVA
jgi:hypothetical protein